jgi:hypothetical protein
MSVRMLAKASLALLILGGLASLSSPIGPAANARNPPGSAISEDAMALIARMVRSFRRANVLSFSYASSLCRSER